ncbi:unnamed protein product [Paramecium sonneborni]|uniref:UvrD-like helicase ATP-binding domain-containing protein n=1 Tax=Paramecium sonneborni TaxID=65129 RepID=A0A8S1R7X8_9CILI|nr:unnamed protein product [Paramecium sonneborni]
MVWILIIVKIELFLEDLLQEFQNAFQIMSYMVVIGQGFFCPQSPITNTKQISCFLCYCFQKYFCCITPENYYIYFEINLEDKPVVQQDKLIGFKFDHVINFITFGIGKNYETIFCKLADYHKKYQQIPSSIDYRSISCQTNTQIRRNQKQFYCEKPLFYFNEIDKWGECQFNEKLNSDKFYKWNPTKIDQKKLSDEEIDNYYFDKIQQKWMTKNFNKILLKVKEFNEIRKHNDIILKQYADFTSASKIIDIMQQLPKFKITITQQERQVIASKQNTLIIGRSGTGKTTCNILKLFALQALFQMRLKLFSQENEKLLLKSISNNTKVNLHCVFTTQNPVLISEIRKYYKKLIKSIKDSKRKNEDQKIENQDFRFDLDYSFISQKQSQIIDQINESSIDLIIQNETFLNEEFEFEEQLDEDEQDLEKVDNLNSFDQLSDDQFPAFLSIKKLLLLIDSSLQFPFFAQDKFQKNVKNKKTGWNQEKTVYISQQQKTMKQINLIDFNEYAQFEDQEFEILTQEDIFKKSQEAQQNSKLKDDKDSQNNQKVKEKQTQVVEVDYEAFIKRFWPNMKKRSQRLGCDEISLPTLIWTLIYSHIKGSQFSYHYPNQYLPKSVFIQQNPCNLSLDTINLIYEYFYQYEKLKKENGDFDLMDLVNYMICELDKGTQNCATIHYLFVDEIQDLPCAFLSLFSRLIEQGYQFCGDTAQTIAKGVGFRFEDIKNFFKKIDDQKLKNFELHQLTINFRSHNNILQLANNIVNLIELYFPKSIDKLNKEISNLKGPKPIIINSKDTEVLFSFLTGDIQNLKTEVQIEFGCNQVILVKNHEVMENIPSQLKLALILTIEESKGLEFEDVILYNFFTDSTLNPSYWDLLDYIFIDEVDLDIDQYNLKLTKHEEQLLLQQDNKNNKNLIESQQCLKEKKLRLNPNISTLDLNYYKSLLQELKYLYVAATRAKIRLIIFDEQPQKRQKLEILWKKLDLVQTFDQNYYQNPENLYRKTTQNSKEEWFAVGMKMLANKYYDQAIKCFLLAEDQLYFYKSQAYSLALKAEKLYIQCEDYNQINSDLKIVSKIQQQNRQMYEKLQQEMYDCFSQAGEAFSKCKMKKNAAACYFSAQKFDQALIYYLQTECWEEAAEVALGMELFHVAGILQLKTQNISQSIEAFLLYQNNLVTLHLLYVYKNQITQSQRKLWLKILPIVLQECLEQSKNYQNQINQKYIGKKLDFSILENNTQFQQEFQQQIKMIEMSAVDVQNQDLLYQTVLKYINKFLDEIFRELQTVFFLNQTIEVYRISIQQTEKADQHQVELIQTIFQYFELEEFHHFLFNYQQSLIQQQIYYISCVYNKSPLYVIGPLKDYFKLPKYVQENLEIQYQSQNPLCELQEIFKQFTFSKCTQQQLMQFSLYQLGLCELMIKLFESSFKDQLFSSTPTVYGGKMIQSFKKVKQNAYKEILMTFQQYQEICEFSKQQQSQLNLNDDLQIAQANLYLSSIQMRHTEDRKLIKKFRNFQYLNTGGIKKNDDFNIFLQKLIQKDTFINDIVILYLIYELKVKDNNLLFKEFLTLSYQNFLKLLIKIQDVIDLFKYNRYKERQIKIFNCLKCIFSISLPCSEIFKPIGQSFIIVKKSSRIFSKLLNTFENRKGSQAFFIDQNQELIMFSSGIVISTIKEIYKQFLKSYVQQYSQLRILENNQLPFIIRIFPFCALKTLNQEYLTENILFNEMISDESLLNCLSHQLSDEILNYWYQFPRIMDQTIANMFIRITYKYFSKIFFDSTKEKIHKHILTGIHLENMASQNIISKQFIQNIKEQRIEQEKYQKDINLSLQNPFLSSYQLTQYKTYADYLLQNKLGMSILNIELYIKYYTALKDICQKEQVQKDLSICTLNYIVCKKSYVQSTDKINQLAKQAKDASQVNLTLEQILIEEIIDLRNFKKQTQYSMKLILPKILKSFFQDNLCQNVYIDLDNFDERVMERVIQILIKQMIQGIQLSVVLLVTIIINTNNQDLESLINFELSEIKIQDYEKKIVDNITLILHLIRLNDQARIEEFEERQKKYSQQFINCEINYNNKLINDLKNQIQQLSINEFIQDDFQLQQSLKQQEKQKFKSLYLGMRILTYTIFSSIELQEENLVKKSLIYDHINLIRRYFLINIKKFSQLIEILSNKQFQKKKNYISITFLMQTLTDEEAKVDLELKDQSLISNQQSIEKSLSDLHFKIENWIQQNKQLQEQLNNIQEEQKNHAKQQTAKIFVLKQSSKQFTK